MTSRSYSSFSKTASDGFNLVQNNQNALKKWEDKHMYKTSYYCQSEKNVNFKYNNIILFFLK